jgi:hypothetical protein
MYVGRAASSALIERVPSHFDVRPEGWFGTRSKKLAEQTSPTTTPIQCLSRALDMKLALLVADVGGVDLGSAEQTLRETLKPKLHTPKRPRPIELSTPLADIA